jgi:DNA-binding transcriptional regulator GbsR (MarR family)
MKSHSNIHDKLKKLQDHNITVSSDIKGHKFYVTVKDEYNAIYRNKMTKGKELHTSSTINKAITDTINYCYEKLIKNKL